MPIFNERGLVLAMPPDSPVALSSGEDSAEGAEEEEDAGERDRKVEPDALAPAGREGGSRAARDCDGN